MQLDPTQLIGSVSWWVISSICGLLFFAAIAITFLAWTLHKYGNAIKRLNEYETIAKLASLARSMEDSTASYGRTLLVVQELSRKIGGFSQVLDDTQQRIGTLTSKLNALQSIIEDSQRIVTPASAAPISVTPTTMHSSSLNDAGDIRNWEAIKDGWNEVRDEIESVIENLDGRTRRKYSEAPRYKYAEIISFLEDDKVLGGNAALDAKNMDRVFLKVRPRNAKIDPDDVKNFDKWKSTVLTEIKRYRRSQKAQAGTRVQQSNGSTEPHKVEDATLSPNRPEVFDAGSQ